MKYVEEDIPLTWIWTKYKEYSAEKHVFTTCVREYIHKLAYIIISLGKTSLGKKVKFLQKVKIPGDCFYSPLSKWDLIFHDNNFIKWHITDT